VTEICAERLIVAPFAERPDLLAKVFEPEIQSAVPEFMRHDPAGSVGFGAFFTSTLCTRPSEVQVRLDGELSSQLRAHGGCSGCSVGAAIAYASERGGLHR
jgi:hypothetical protein